MNPSLQNRLARLFYKNLASGPVRDACFSRTKFLGRQILEKYALWNVTFLRRGPFEKQATWEVFFRKQVLGGKLLVEKLLFREAFLGKAD